MEVLKKLDGDMPVVAAKFEIGFDEIHEHQIITLALNAGSYSSNSCGPHVLEQDIEANGHQVTKAFLLGKLKPNCIWQIKCDQLWQTKTEQARVA
jgi:hypothetical protein